MRITFGITLRQLLGVSRGSDYLRESSTPVGCEEGGSNAVRFILLNSKMPVGFPTGVFYFTLNLR